jgi:8-oxo-dGTP pyrophosphatase MutT (NUDIX family)
MQRHFTATCFVVDAEGRVLLLWHKHLQRWMPPGGHVDPDELPEDAAARECLEETGLAVEILGDTTDDLFVDATHEGRMLKRPLAMLLEEIPARPERQQGPHQHMDFLYLGRLLDPKQALTLARDEADALRWFTAAEIAALPHQEIFHNVRHFIITCLPRLLRGRGL